MLNPENEIRSIVQREEQREGLWRKIFQETRHPHLVHGMEIYTRYLPKWILTGLEEKIVLIGPGSEEPGNDAFFDTEKEACSAGYQRFGTDPFMARRVIGLKELKEYGIRGKPIDMSDSKYLAPLMGLHTPSPN